MLRSAKPFVRRAAGRRTPRGARARDALRPDTNRRAARARPSHPKGRSAAKDAACGVDRPSMLLSRCRIGQGRCGYTLTRVQACKGIRALRTGMAGTAFPRKASSRLRDGAPARLRRAQGARVQAAKRLNAPGRRPARFFRLDSVGHIERMMKVDGSRPIWPPGKIRHQRPQGGPPEPCRTGQGHSRGCRRDRPLGPP